MAVSRTTTTTIEPPRRLLIVDDSPTIRKVLARILEMAGHHVETADSGEMAFERCLTNPYDLIVTDLTMGALSGVQLCRLLRSNQATVATPIIMLTAAGDPRSRFWGRTAGADAYITKEAMVDGLLPAVEQLLDSIPKRDATATFRALSKPVRPLEKLSEVLDQHLFDAVVASEVRKLIDEIDDRAAFAHGVCRLLGTIAQYRYLALHLTGPAGRTCTIHARGHFPAKPTDESLAWLGITNPGDVDVIHEGAIDDGPIASGEMNWYPITSGGERLGAIQAFGGDKRFAAEDHRTLTLCATEMSLPIKTLFLMEQTQRLAHTDSLTGVANRHRCGEQLAHEVERARRQHSAFAIAICDVDHFKQVNDRYGHNAGDEVLRQVANTLAEGVRTIDMVGRWGGEEFLILLPNAPAAGGRIVAERIRHMIASTPCTVGPDRVTVSVGVAGYMQGEAPGQLVGRADQALYRAKSRGRNRVEVERVQMIEKAG